MRVLCDDDGEDGNEKWIVEFALGAGLGGMVEGFESGSAVEASFGVDIRDECFSAHVFSSIAMWSAA